MTENELELDLSSTSAPSADWAWARSDEAIEQPSLPAAGVLAVVVAHQAAEWLPRTLQAISQLTDRPGRIVAVAVTSSDDTAAQLAQAQVDGIVDQVVASEPAGFGQAVEVALASQGESDPSAQQWLWLLHDDSEPQPAALRGLLTRAAAEPAPDLLFPKLVGPRRRNHPDRLLEIGQSITPTGARVLSVEPGDIDQLQLDSAPTLGGSSAGLFIRRSAWQQLGGFAAELPLFRDAVDLGWRANDAGLQVVTAPEATLHHHQRGRWGDRRSPLADSLPALDRLTGLRLIAARSPRPALTRLRLWLTSLLQALVLVIGKNPHAAAAAWKAGWQVLADRARVERLRERIASQPWTEQAALRPHRTARLSQALGLVAGSFTDRYRELREDTDTSLDDLIGDDFAGGRSRRQLIAPLSAAVVVLAVLCVLAGRRLLGSGQLTALHLSQAPASLSAAFQAWLHPAAGHPGPNAPWLGLAALGSALSGGRPELWARVVIIGAPLWAAVAMVVLARAVLARAVSQRSISSYDGPTSPVVALIAVAWGVLVAALGLPGRGSVSAIAVAVLAPLAIAAALAWFHQDADEADSELPTGERWRAPGLLALWLGLLGTAQPVIWLIAVVIAGLHLAITRRLSGRTAVVALGPALLSAPWWARLIDQPGRLLTDADPTVASADFAPRPLAMALGRLGQGDAPTVFGVIAIGVLWLAAVAFAVKSARAGRSGPLAVVAVAAVAIAIASMLSRVVITVDGSPVRPAVDTWVTLAVLALLTSTLWALATTEARGWRRLAVGTLAVTVLAAGSGWQWAATDSPATVSQSRLPAHVIAVQDSARAGRALMIDVTPEGTGWRLSSTTQPQWGSGELHPAGGHQAWASTLTPIVVQIGSATVPEDLATRLTRLGISHIWLAHGTPNQVNALTNTAGLVAARSDSTTVVFTVAGLVSRAAVTTPAGELQPIVDGQVAAGVSEISIVEPADPRWRVSIGDTPVTVKSDQPLHLSVAPAGATGSLTWATAPSTWAAVWEGIVLVVLLVMAAPTLGRPRLTGDGARFEETR